MVWGEMEWSGVRWSGVEWREVDVKEVELSRNSILCYQNLKVPLGPHLFSILYIVLDVL